jgi:DNA-binding IclR family transcriptional regulator
LQALATNEQSVGVRELARQLILESTWVSRLLGTLAHLGLAEKNEERKYRPGPGMHVLSAQALKGSRLLEKSWPVLRELVDGKLTVSLGVLWREQVCYLYHSKPDRPFEEGVFHFDLFPAEKSTIGLVLLSERGAPAPKGLAAELAQIRKQRFCRIDRGGTNRSIAVPLGQPAVAALAFAGSFPVSKIPTLLKRLQSAAHHIEEKL